MSDNSRIGRAAWVIFVLVALTAIFVALTLPPRFDLARSSLLGLGLAIAAFPVSAAIWGLVGGDPVSHKLAVVEQSLAEFDLKLQSTTEVLADARKSGLERVYRSAGLIPSEFWTSLHANSQEHVDLCGRALYSWVMGNRYESFLDTVLENLEKGVSYRILLYGPANQTLDTKDSPFDLDLKDRRPNSLTVARTSEAFKLYQRAKNDVQRRKPDRAENFSIRGLVG